MGLYGNNGKTKQYITALPLLCTLPGDHLSSLGASAGKWLPLTWQKTQLSTWRGFTQASEGCLCSRPFCIRGPRSESPHSLGSPTLTLFENANILEQVTLISSVLRGHQSTQFPFTQGPLAQLGKSPVQTWRGSQWRGVATKPTQVCRERSQVAILETESSGVRTLTHNHPASPKYQPTSVASRRALLGKERPRFCSI